VICRANFLRFEVVAKLAAVFDLVIFLLKINFQNNNENLIYFDNEI